MSKFFRFLFCWRLIALTSLVLGVVNAQEDALDANPSSFPGERRALIIAVSHYISDEFGALPSVDADAELMKKELLNSGFKTQVMAHSSINVPTREHIKDAIKTFADSCQPSDLAFIMLTGHGLRDAKTGKDYFIPMDAEDADFDTFVSLDFIVETLGASRAKVKGLLVDACRAEGKRGDASTVGKLVPTPGMFIFQSCSPGEKSYFTKDDKNGLFVYHFIEGLQGGAIREDGRVSVFGAFDYACEKVKDRQRPVMSNRDVDDFVLSENKEWIGVATMFQNARKAYEVGDYVKTANLIKGTTIRDVPQRLREIIAKFEAEIEGENGKTWDNASAGEERNLFINGVETVFRYCPLGTFTMGSPRSETDREDWEIQHKVTLTQGFWMMETETTQKLWTAVMKNNPSENNKEGDELPVENVSWEDCQQFIAELNRLNVAPSGFKFALPTEAQWEYACRAGTTTPFPWGDSLNGDKANCDGVTPYGTEIEGTYLDKTAPVKSYKPNAWNLYDMCGNVFEWCQDYFASYSEAEQDYFAYSEIEQIDPCVEDPAESKEKHRAWYENLKGKYRAWRVIRGGSWAHNSLHCRAAYRFWCDPKKGSYDLGFRVALVRE